MPYLLKEILTNENKTFVFSRFESNWKYYLTKFSLPVLDVLFKFLLYVKRASKREAKYDVVLCCIFKDEGAFLKEWIEYHLLVGVKHFYMYNNFSSDNYQEILKPYIQKELVTLIEWPVSQGQFAAYKNWFENYRSDTQWVSFLDIDEFICPYFEMSIPDWIQKYSNYPCVMLYWKMFGTSGKIEHDKEKLVTEQYTLSWDKLYAVGKVLYNTDYEINKFDESVHHSTTTKIRFLGMQIIVPPINEFKCFVHGNVHRIGNRSLADFTIQINHYWSKAFMIYDAKIRKGYVAEGENPYLNLDYFLAHERHNKAVDHKIFRFMIELKKNLGLLHWK